MQCDMRLFSGKGDSLRANLTGQASTELIIIMAVALFTIIMFMTLAGNFIAGTNVQQSQETTRDSVQRLARAADSVYSQGEGASEIVQITLSTSTKFDPNLTFVGKPVGSPFSDSPNTINVRVEDTDVYAITRAPLHGSLPSTFGSYSMRVYSAGSYVVISPHIAKLDRHSLFVSMAKDETRNELIQASSLSNGTISATATLEWGFSDVVISYSPDAFNLDPSGTPFEINVTASSSAEGLYSSELLITARGQGGEVEEFTVPVTINVQ